MKISGIYMWKCLPENKKYIGQAEDLSKRYGEFVNFDKSYSGIRIDKARMEYSNICYWEYSIILECRKESLDENETKYILEYRSNEPEYGYNMTIGGTTGTKGYTHTEETREILSERQREFQKTVPEEVRKKRARHASSFVDRDNPEYRKHLSEAQMGHGESEERRDKIRKSQEPNMKPVVMLTLDFLYVDEFASVREAGRSLCKNPNDKKEADTRTSAVRQCTNEKENAFSAKDNVSGNRFIFVLKINYENTEWLKEYKNKYDNRYKKSEESKERYRAASIAYGGKPVVMYDLDGNELDRFSCINVASAKTGITKTQISRNANGKTKICDDKWIFRLI